MSEQKPYVISAELEYSDSAYVRKTEIDNFREGLTNDLQAMGKQVTWVGAATLRKGLEQKTARTHLPVVSLDERYVRNADAMLGVSRAVEADLTEAGYDARLGTPGLVRQLDTLGRAFAGREIALADDIVFSGEMLAWVQRQLQVRGVQATSVLCGVAIGDGAQKLAARGLEVECVVNFKEVEDELCERDFTFTSGSGRKIKGQSRSALYFDNIFGKPEQWASIPTDVAGNFCLASLRRNLRLMTYDAPLPLFAGYAAEPAAKAITKAIKDRQ